MNEEIEVEVARREPVRLAGLTHVGPYHEIGAAFERLAAQAGARGLLGPDARMFAIYFDDAHAKPERELRSFAGMRAPEGLEPWQGLEIIEIPGGETASYVHVGPYAELEAAYQRLYGGWLPRSGRDPADRPAYEEYLNDPTGLPPSEWRTRIHLPLA